MKRKTTISIQVDESIYDYVKNQARLEGRSMSNWMLQLILFRKNTQLELPFFGQPKHVQPEFAGQDGGG